MGCNKTKLSQWRSRNADASTQRRSTDGRIHDRGRSAIPRNGSCRLADRSMAIDHGHLARSDEMEVHSVCRDNVLSEPNYQSNWPEPELQLECKSVTNPGYRRGHEHGAVDPGLWFQRKTRYRNGRLQPAGQLLQLRTTNPAGWCNQS